MSGSGRFCRGRIGRSNSARIRSYVSPWQHPHEVGSAMKSRLPLREPTAAVFFSGLPSTHPWAPFQALRSETTSRPSARGRVGLLALVASAPSPAIFTAIISIVAPAVIASATIITAVAPSPIVAPVTMAMPPPPARTAIPPMPVPIPPRWPVIPAHFLNRAGLQITCDDAERRRLCTRHSHEQRCRSRCREQYLFQLLRSLIDQPTLRG